MRALWPACEGLLCQGRLGLRSSAELPAEAVLAPEVLCDGHAPQPGHRADLQHKLASTPPCCGLQHCAGASWGTGADSLLAIMNTSS